MNNKNLEKWRSDFGLTNDQLEYIKAGCSRAIESFNSQKNRTGKETAQTIKKFRDLESALYQLNDPDLGVLSAFAFMDEDRSKGGSIEKLYLSFDFLRYAPQYLKKLCEDAIRNYEASDIAKGGRPERIPGRRFLAHEVAMIMKNAGITPTKTPDTGAFSRLLEIVFKSAGLDPKDIPQKSVLYYAVSATE